MAVLGVSLPVFVWVVELVGLCLSTLSTNMLCNIIMRDFREQGKI